MDTLHGTLECTGNTLRICTPSGFLDLWPIIEAMLYPLSGKHVFPKKDTLLCSLTRNEDTDWVFYYNSRNGMFLTKPNNNDFIDFAIHLESLLRRLNGRGIIIEADKKHFKICADSSTPEQV